eukprot:CAMPEP_0201476702 /NCGR_PEP_ID=MMETSP0151_2-20130828/1852_1 /ASSEMBLY_ACC=CAM_ASM_000257 /TAXON_ID=200890 /ORGANISM="Paramoeba atlantica, Strain 621/1 / CCAP 1560/9" /LENGTH=474 /DNA_ID=CAMNT_0047857163 /DNA_START=187 /DNA_END=1611 /DNA_ORIENTATION=-
MEGVNQFIPHYAFIGRFLPRCLHKIKTGIEFQRAAEPILAKNGVASYCSYRGNSLYTREVDHVKELMQSSDGKFLKPTHLYQALELFGPNIVSARDGAQWKKHRSTCNPAFGIENLEFVVEVTSRRVNRLFAHWEEGQDPSSFSVNPEKGLVELTLSVISEAGFGQQFGQDNVKASNGEMTFEKAMDIVSEKMVLMFVLPGFLFSLPIPFLNEIDSAFRVFKQTLEEIISSREDGDGTGRAIKRDLLSQLMQANRENQSNSHPKLTNSEILGDVFMFLFAGHETSAGTLHWAIRLLSLHPEVQKRARQEVDDLVGDRTDLTYAEVKNLVYCRCIIQETLRLEPVVPSLPKYITSDGTLGDLHLPAGTLVNVDIRGLHRSPKYWKEPEKYWPERFDERVNPHPVLYSFLPFSDGKRNCIGQKLAMLEMTATIARLVQTYEIGPPQGVSEADLLRGKSVITYKPEMPYDITFRKRK